MGRANDKFSEILRGLSAEERYVTKNSYILKGRTRKSRDVPRTLGSDYDWRNLEIFDPAPLDHVGAYTVLMAGLGAYNLTRLNIDAVPDITNIQVQVSAQAPRIVSPGDRAKDNFSD